MLKYERLLKTIPGINWKKEKYINFGWDYDVILLDNNYVVRIPKNQAAIKRVLVDFCLLKFLNGIKKFYIPRPIYLDKKARLAVYKIVKGRPVTIASYKKMTDQQEEEFAESLGQFLKTLHSIPTRKIRDCKLPTNDLRNISKIISKDAAIIRPYLNKIQNVKLGIFLKERKSVLKNTNLVLTHGDLNSDHIFINNGNLGVIDFSDASISDPAVDLAGLLSYGPHFVRQVLKYYKSNLGDFLILRAEIYHKDVAIKVLAAAVRRSKQISIREAKRFFDQRLK